MMMAVAAGICTPFFLLNPHQHKHKGQQKYFNGMMHKGVILRIYFFVTAQVVQVAQSILIKWVNLGNLGVIKKYDLIMYINTMIRFVLVASNQMMLARCKKAYLCMKAQKDSTL